MLRPMYQTTVTSWTPFVLAAGLLMTLTHPASADDGDWTWPYQGTLGTGVAPLFRLTQTGTGACGQFRIIPGDQVNNTRNALYVYTSGRGKAGYFRISNTNNSNQALFARTNGNGHAAFFRTTKPGNTRAALKVLSNSDAGGSAIEAQNTEDGRAAYFKNHEGAFGFFTIRVENLHGAGRSALFIGDVVVNGDLDVNGTLSKDAGAFKIDHPLDPANKYLYHSFVESPDMKNIYDGVAALDANGEAVVELPEWFEALNGNFRYQLTCIGGFARVYVAEEIADNTFVIAGGRPGMKVSWQVTGIRKDAYAQANRIPVEQDKPEHERGLFRHPELYGQSQELRVQAESQAPPLQEEPEVPEQEEP